MLKWITSYEETWCILIRYATSALKLSMYNTTLPFLYSLLIADRNIIKLHRLLGLCWNFLPIEQFCHFNLPVDHRFLQWIMPANTRHCFN